MLSLFAAGAGALALSLSGVFLVPVLVGTLALALVLTRGAGARRLGVLGAAGLAALPALVVGPAMRLAVRGSHELHATPDSLNRWLPEVQHYMGVGSAEWIWLISLPLAAIIVTEWRPRAYLVAFPLLLGLGAVNPLLFHLVAGRVTSYLTYVRLFWLFPVGTGLAVLLTLILSRLVGQRNVAPLALAFVGILAGLALPGIYVWGARNSFIGPLGTPHVAENLEKIPNELETIARRLEDDPDKSATLVLANEQIASILVPYARDLRFVQTRESYTLPMLAQAGRVREALERHLLVSAVESERFMSSPADRSAVPFLGPPGEVQLLYGGAFDDMSRDLRVLLERYRVKHAITGPGDRGGATLATNGFTPLVVAGRFTLWQRSNQIP